VTSQTFAAHESHSNTAENDTNGVERHRRYCAVQVQPCEALRNLTYTAVHSRIADVGFNHWLVGDSEISKSLASDHVRFSAFVKAFLDLRLDFAFDMGFPGMHLLPAPREQHRYSSHVKQSP
jgi:hypothetical protein